MNKQNWKMIDDLDPGSYECFIPFGPLVYKGDIRGEFLDFLLKHLDSARSDTTDMSSYLVGNIKEQKSAPFPQREFCDLVKPHVINYLKGTYDREIATDRCCKDGKQADKFLDPTEHKINFSLGEGPWVNFSAKNEFNPMHNHNGVISAVAFLDIPEELQEERETNGFEFKTAGCLDIIHDNQHAVIHPKTGNMYLFPSYLWHLVYPYHSDVERISMSFNVTDVRFDKMHMSGPPPGGLANYH